MAQLVQGDQNSTLARALEYQRLVASGVPPQQAFSQAFPQGIPQAPTPQQQAKESQNQAIGQVGGTLLGALGTYYGASAIKGALGSGAAGAGTAGTAGAGAAGAAGAGTAAATGAGAAGAAGGGAAGAGFGGGAASTAAGNIGSSTAAMVAAPLALITGGIEMKRNFNAAEKEHKTHGKRQGLEIEAKKPINWITRGPFAAARLYGAALGDKDRYLTERSRLEKLRARGIDVPDSLLPESAPSRGRSTQELIAEEQAKIDKGGYGNVEFAKTRDESKLKPEDIWGYSAFMDKFGNDWLKTFNEQQRRDIAQEALNAGAVREKYGSIDINWDKIPTAGAKPQPASTPTNKPQTKIGSKLVDAATRNARKR